MDKHEQRRMLKFHFLHEKRYKAIYGELGGVLGEAGVSLATLSIGANASKRSTFPLITKTGRGDR
jgi:hypothetical protein